MIFQANTKVSIKRLFHALFLALFLPFFLAAIFATFGTGASASHIPQSLIDAVYYEFENDYCQKDPDCTYPASGGDYETCMKYFLHEDYTEAELERILRFKNQNGYFLETDLDDYDWLIEEWVWVGC